MTPPLDRLSQVTKSSDQVSADLSSPDLKPSAGGAAPAAPLTNTPTEAEFPEHATNASAEGASPERERTRSEGRTRSERRKARATWSGRARSAAPSPASPSA